MGGYVATAHNAIRAERAGGNTKASGSMSHFVKPDLTDRRGNLVNGSRLKFPYKSGSKGPRLSRDRCAVTR